MENVSPSDIIDYKVTKTIYPFNNNNDSLEFLIGPDPNLFTKKNKLLIRGTVRLHEKFVPDTNWVSKMFSQLIVEVQSQVVSKNITQ